MRCKFLLNCFLLFGLGISFLAYAKADPVPPKEKFLWGIVFIPDENNRGLKNQVADLQELGVTQAKWWMDWSETEPIVLLHDLEKKKVRPACGPKPFGERRPAPTERGYSFLTRADVEKHQEIIEEYAHPEDPKSRFHGLVDWSASDEIITLLNENGIEPVPLIGDATTAPYLKPSDTETFRIAPEPEDWQEADEIKGVGKSYQGIGKEAYLGHILLYTAAAARRYQKGKFSVKFWNTENELNWAYVHVSEAGWRKGESWKDQEFLTKLLATLDKGIHLGNPKAQTTMNINIHDPGWEKDLIAWRDLMDVIGLGAYPNYLFSKPVLGRMVGNAVTSAAALSEGKPVVVMETGYPTGPETRGWGETQQVEFIREAIRSAREAGAAGFFYFRLDDAKETTMTKKVQEVESHWGLVDAKGRRKPAFFVYQEFIKGRVKSKPAE